MDSERDPSTQTQNTIQNLERIHSHYIQLQSQLLGSALTVMAGQAHVTSNPRVNPALCPLRDPMECSHQSSCQPAPLQISTAPSTAQQRVGGAGQRPLETPGPCGMVPRSSSGSLVWTRPQRAATTASTKHGGSDRHLEAVSNQRSPQTGATAAETDPVTIATPSNDLPQQNRSNQHHPEAPAIPTAIQSPAGSHVQALANHRQSAVKRAKQVLQETAQQNTQMEWFHAKEIRPSNPNPLAVFSPGGRACLSSSSSSQPPLPPPVISRQPQHSQDSSILSLHRKPVVPSMFEEAGQVLRQVQRQRKVLEENLEAMLRAKDTELLNYQLEAVSTNRDYSEEVHIKRMVDAWISSLTKDIQAEMTSHTNSPVKDSSKGRDAPLTLQKKATGSRKVKERLQSMPRKAGIKMEERGGGGQTDRNLEQKEASGRLRAGQRASAADPGRGEREGERQKCLMRLYGRAPYEGHRRTLRSPYLRFSSPASPRRKSARPRLVERITGVKVKTTKTQTNLAPPISSPLCSSAGQPLHYIFRPFHMTPGVTCERPVNPVEGSLIPMAIPLGQPRIDTALPQPSRVLLFDDSLSQAQTTTPSGPQMSNKATLPGISESVTAAQSQMMAIAESELEEEEEEEESMFPGTDFLSVTDVVQEESAVSEKVMELSGQASSPVVMYHGPSFPPQPSVAPPEQEHTSAFGLIQQRETLESRLVDWVEQQLMARMISEMYRPPPSDPAHNDSILQSELEHQSVASEIVQGAEGGCVQLFVDAGLPVDSVLLRQLVCEAVAETVSVMLGQNTKIPGQEPTAPQESLIPTPVLTPEPNSAEPSQQLPLLATPLPSEPTSLEHSPHPEPTEATQQASATETDPEPVATPLSTPEPSPPGTSHSLLPRVDTHLPLDEEDPNYKLKTHAQSRPRPLVMSVEEKEPVLSSPSPPPSRLPPQTPSSPTLSSTSAPRPEPTQLPPTSSGDSSTSSSTSSSSSTGSRSSVTVGTDTAMKHISEGELIINPNQLLTTTALQEDSVSFLGTSSFSSSLQELQDMEFDPPSEGQVKVHHNPLLTLLAKIDRGLSHTQREGFWEEEGEEVSMGEVNGHQRFSLLEPSDRNTKPKRTTNARSMVSETTNSISCGRSLSAGQRQASSPGQLSMCEDLTQLSFEVTNQSLVTMGDLAVELVRTSVVISDLQTDQSFPHPSLKDTHTSAQAEAGPLQTPEALRPAPIMVRQYEETDPGHTEQEEPSGASRKTSVHLPSVVPEQREEEEEVGLEGPADTDSSANGVF
ncbi:protein TALPID3 [Lampris incognitus]|uniref:protein TALPID3 n=1 Tax=Lampris incognitus TaxID=2546036 RepID=UPI0024B63164|nr:protein TALPID3 [Lampris incognitus]